MASFPSIVPLVLFFAALGVCFWRAHKADRQHLTLCAIAAVIWCSLPLFEPSMRRSGYALVVATFLVIGLTQPFRPRHQDR
jgi:L-lactate permease